MLGATLLAASASAGEAPIGRAPATLRETGLYADFYHLRVDPAHIAFSPQYPLWTDGAAKRRWMSLPPGTAIDGSDPNAWIFPIGVRLWKEFSFAGRRVETRYIERLANGEWLFAAYEWSNDEREARLVSQQGKRGAYPLGNKRAHAIPSVDDCKACHYGGRSPVLGFSAVQLSPDRDANGLHAEIGGVDLRMLIGDGLLVGFPKWAFDAPQRTASLPVERAALGYLHGNCGHCHNQHGSLRNLGLFLRHEIGAAPKPSLASAVGQPIRERAPGQSPDAKLRIDPGRPELSGLIERVGSRYRALQMPPLGTELVDREAVALLARWIAEMNEPRQEVRAKQQRGTQ